MPKCCSTRLRLLCCWAEAEEAKAPINQIRQRAYGDNAHNLTTVTLDDVKREWGLEFVYEQKEWFNLARWKDVIKDLETVKDNEYFDDSYATAGNIGKNGQIVNEFFAKTYKHLHAKYDNRQAKYYRFPIPVGKSGESWYRASESLLLIKQKER